MPRGSVGVRCILVARVSRVTFCNQVPGVVVDRGGDSVTAASGHEIFYLLRVYVAVDRRAIGAGIDHGDGFIVHGPAYSIGPLYPRLRSMAIAAVVVGYV